MSGDKVTIVSVSPFQVGPEKKPHVYPGEFTIPAAKPGEVAVLVVTDSYAVRYIGNDETIRDLQPARKMAESVVYDYKRAKLGYRMDDDGNEVMPGLLIVNGEHTPEEIMTKFPEAVDKARQMQKHWFKALIEIADDSWARDHQHRLITDEMRFAARSLGLTREWDIDVARINNLVVCPFCTKQISEAALKCPNCLEIVNVAAYEKMRKAS